MSSVKFENNEKKIKNALRQRELAIAKALGEKWKKIVKEIITSKGIVDTGNLRDSTRYRTEGSDHVKVGWFENEVPYACRNEFENKKGPFLRPSVLEHKDTYKQIAEKLLKG